MTNFEDIVRTVEIKALRQFHNNLYNQNADSNRFNLRVPCPLCRNGELSLTKAAGPTIDPYDVSFEDGSQATREQQRKSLCFYELGMNSMLTSAKFETSILSCTDFSNKDLAQTCSIFICICKMSIILQRSIINISASNVFLNSGGGHFPQFL